MKIIVNQVLQKSNDHNTSYLEITEKLSIRLIHGHLAFYVECNTLIKNCNLQINYEYHNLASAKLAGNEFKRWTGRSFCCISNRHAFEPLFSIPVLCIAVYIIKIIKRKFLGVN